MRNTIYDGGDTVLTLDGKAIHFEMGDDETEGILTVDIDDDGKATVSRWSAPEGEGCVDFTDEKPASPTDKAALRSHFRTVCGNAPAWVKDAVLDALK